MPFRLSNAPRCSGGPITRHALQGRPSGRPAARIPLGISDAYPGPTIRSTFACEADVYLFRDEAIEPRHALIHDRGRRFEIEDMDIADGTYVNGVPVQRQILKSGDQIVLDKSFLESMLKEAKRRLGETSPSETLMSISFQCKSCGKKLKAPDSAAGTTSTCPACGAKITCPDPVQDAEVVEMGPPPGFNPFADLDDDKPYGVAKPSPVEETSTES